MNKYIYIYLDTHDTHDIHDTHEMFKTSSELVPENIKAIPSIFIQNPGEFLSKNSWVKIKSPKNSWVLKRFRAPYV